MLEHPDGVRATAYVIAIMHRRQGPKDSHKYVATEGSHQLYLSRDVAPR
jgi:hypothetical protein